MNGRCFWQFFDRVSYLGSENICSMGCLCRRQFHIGPIFRCQSENAVEIRKVVMHLVYLRLHIGSDVDEHRQLRSVIRLSLEISF